MKRIVVVGGGYAGILTAKKLAKKLKKQEVKITLIDKNPYHTMLTELHEVAAGRVDQDSIKIYFDQVFAGRDIDFSLDEVKTVDFDSKKVIGQNTEYSYDYLVVASGCKPTFFGKNEIKENVFTLWSLEDSIKLNRVINDRFEEAAKTTDAVLRNELLTFVVVGAGFTGVEMAGELAEYVPELCFQYNIARSEVNIKIMDMAPRVLPVFSEKLSRNAHKKLEKLGVEIYTGFPSGEITKDYIVYNGEEFRTKTVIWTTGVEGSELMDNIPGVEMKGRGRIACNSFLQSENYDDVYVAGDNIFYIAPGQERPLPQMVENAEHSADLVAHNIATEFNGNAKKEYQPKFHGAMVCIGGRKGCAQVGTPGFMIDIKNSFIALFIKHFINIIYFIQVLGWTKIWSYIKHEFFNVPNNRSFVGGLASKKTPSLWLVPLRLWLGFSWFLQGLPKLTHKLLGGMEGYCETSEMPVNNGLLCKKLGYLDESDPEANLGGSNGMASNGDNYDASDMSDTDSGASEPGDGGDTPGDGGDTPGDGGDTPGDGGDTPGDGGDTPGDGGDTPGDGGDTPGDGGDLPGGEPAHVDGFAAFITNINDFFDGLKPDVTIPGFGLAYNMNSIFAHLHASLDKWILLKWLVNAIEWCYDLFMNVSEWMMTEIISYMAPLFEVILAVGETFVGILLILGLFTSVAAAGSLMLSIMVIVGSLISYNGIFLGSLVWYLTGSIALLSFGGSGQPLSLDYYVMPKVLGFLQKVPVVKKWYLYGDRTAK